MIYGSSPFKFFRILAKFIGGGFPAINIVVAAHLMRWLNKFLTSKFSEIRESKIITY